MITLAKYGQFFAIEGEDNIEGEDKEWNRECIRKHADGKPVFISSSDACFKPSVGSIFILESEGDMERAEVGEVASCFFDALIKLRGSKNVPFRSDVTDDDF